MELLSVLITRDLKIAYSLKIKKTASLNLKLKVELFLGKEYLGLRGNTKIPPTVVEVVRPKVTDN